MDKVLLTPKERAIWALLGDPYMHVPRPLEELVDRITTAIKQQLASYIEAKKDKDITKP